MSAKVKIPDNCNVDIIYTNTNDLDFYVKMDNLWKTEEDYFELGNNCLSKFRKIKKYMEKYFRGARIWLSQHIDSWDETMLEEKLYDFSQSITYVKEC